MQVKLERAQGTMPSYASLRTKANVETGVAQRPEAAGQTEASLGADAYRGLYLVANKKAYARPARRRELLLDQIYLAAVIASALVLIVAV